MALAVETVDLTRRYGQHVVLDRVNLRVQEGAVFGYLGLNGAGKTSTIKILCTLLRPSEGVARVGGHDVVADPVEVRRVIGLVGDEGGESQPWWTAREYVRYTAALRGVGDARGAAEAALDAAGLDAAWRGRPIGAFSAGMKRRTEIARALVGKPRILFLDEPTRGLDLPGKRQVWDILLDLARQENVTVFVSSHEVAEIQALCQEIATIAGGRLTYRGPASSLGDSAEAFERRLLALLDGTRRTTFTPVSR